MSRRAEPSGLAWNALLPTTWWIWTIGLGLVVGIVAKTQHASQMVEGWSIAGALGVGLAIIPIVRGLHWRWLQRIAPPLDLDGYLAALGKPARRVHVLLELDYDGAPPDALAQLGLGELAIAGSTARVRSPGIVTQVRLGRYGTRTRPDNGRVARWFRREAKRILRAAPPRALRVQLLPY